MKRLIFHFIFTSQVLAIFLAIFGYALAGTLPAAVDISPVPSIGSTTILGDRIGGNFAYRVVERRPYVVPPVVDTRLTPGLGGVTYSGALPWSYPYPLTYPYASLYPYSLGYNTVIGRR